MFLHRRDRPPGCSKDATIDTQAHPTPLAKHYLDSVDQSVMSQTVVTDVQTNAERREYQLKGWARMSSELSEDTELVVVEEHLTSEIDDETVVLQTETETYYGVEGVGGRAWELLQRPRTLGELQSELVEEYDVDPERCRRDVEAFVADLLDEELVERVDDDGANGR